MNITTKFVSVTGTARVPGSNKEGQTTAFPTENGSAWKIGYVVPNTK